MKPFKPSIIITAIFALTVSAFAQAPSAPAAGKPATPAAKPKPFSSSDTRAYLAVAESLQFQLNMSLRLRSKFKETDPELVRFGSGLHKEATEIWTPAVDLATSRGVDGKKIPLEMTKIDKAKLTKLNAIKDEKKWTLAYFELFSKESKKNALDAEKTAKTIMDPDLKAFVENAHALLKSQSETVEKKYLELKGAK